MKNKQLIKQEIERIIEEETPISKGSDYYHGAKESMEKLLQFIDSLPEEPASEDLEEEMIRWHKEHFGNKRDWEKTSGEYLTRKSQLDIAQHFAEWQRKKDQETIKLAEDHAMLAGMSKMKEEMMKDAIEGWCINDGHILNDIRTLETEKANLKIGDEVKIIIVKTEQK